jgi:hypothetical protein
MTNLPEKMVLLVEPHHFIASCPVGKAGSATIAVQTIKQKHVNGYLLLL